MLKQIYLIGVVSKYFYQTIKNTFFLMYLVESVYGWYIWRTYPQQNGTFVFKIRNY